MILTFYLYDHFAQSTRSNRLIHSYNGFRQDRILPNLYEKSISSRLVFFETQDRRYETNDRIHSVKIVFFKGSFTLARS